jgi:hypothetical protein
MSKVAVNKGIRPSASLIQEHGKVVGNHGCACCSGEKSQSTVRPEVADRQS